MTPQNNMNPKLKEHLISALNTFLTAFLLAIGTIGIDISNLDRAALISLGAVGARAGVKALQQWLVLRLTKK